MKQLSMFDESPMAEMKDKWRKTIEGDGGFCPCCGKWGKIYKYKLSQHLALALRWIMVHGDEEGWVDVQKKGPRWMLRAKTYPLLVHWQMIEGAAKRSGIWRVTQKGREFATGQTSAAAAVWVYDNTIYEVSDSLTSYRGCFGKHFDFDELMSDRYDWTKAPEKP
jgi:hypothetical protein